MNETATAFQIGRTNAFARTILDLERAPDLTSDLFSRSALGSLDDRADYRWSFPLSQVFEPEVLDEVALLAGVDARAARRLEHRPSARAQSLHDDATASVRWPVETALVVAGALVSLSRFERAREVLAPHRASPEPRARFEVAMLDFITANRTDMSASDMEAAFLQMRAAAESEDVPRDRLLDACAQAVVWYLKRSVMSAETFEWFARTGNQLVQQRRHELGAATLSSWFRGVAMIPASRRNAPFTRHLMKVAGDVAEDAIGEVRSGDGSLELTLRKTYYESSVKEYLYVARDQEKALEFSDLLIATDPAWSVSLGEKAEVCESFGLVEEAANLYDAAAVAGPPYVRHHAVKAAALRDRLGDPEGALDRHLAVCAIGTPSTASIAAALEVAERVSPARRRDVATALAAAPEV